MSTAGTERIRLAKTAVQGAIHQRTALGYGQTHVAQAANYRPKQIGSQVVWRVRRGRDEDQRGSAHRGSSLFATRYSLFAPIPIHHLLRTINLTQPAVAQPDKRCARIAITVIFANVLIKGLQ